MQPPSTRRRVLRSAALVGITAIAGCSAGNRAATEPDQSTATATDETATSTPTVSDAPRTPPESIDDWITDANGYRSDIPRFTPGSRPTIAVGHPIDGGMSFDPPAIEIAPTTSVTWDWTGHGGPHNVVALDGTFDSGRSNAQAGTKYQYTFDEPGAYPFVSEPNRGDGMRGVVFVNEPPSTGNPTVDEWVGESSNFDGDIVDRTDAETTTISVGASGNRDHFAFDPPVLKVSTGTVVSWDWTGHGGPHSIGFEDLDIGNESPATESGVHFQHTFESTGTYRYRCRPHRSLGAKGALIVE